MRIEKKDVAELWMRSSRVDRASDCQCQCRNIPAFDPCILHSGIRGAADEAVLNKVHKKIQKKKKKESHAYGLFLGINSYHSPDSDNIVTHTILASFLVFLLSVDYTV